MLIIVKLMTNEGAIHIHVCVGVCHLLVLHYHKFALSLLINVYRHSFNNPSTSLLSVDAPGIVPFF